MTAKVLKLGGHYADDGNTWIGFETGMVLTRTETGRLEIDVGGRWTSEILELSGDDEAKLIAWLTAPR